MVEPLFAADSIGKSFRGNVVLKAASIWARPGSISVLLGRNGCGKSTLFRIAAGLMAPDHGIIRFRDTVYTRASRGRMARDGFFFLPDRDLLSHWRTLDYHFRALRWYHRNAPVESLIERLDLAALRSRLASSLSGGERRRAEVAIALACEPACLLADEPFAGISPKDAEDLGEVFVECARRGCAVIISGHEVPQLLRIADEIVWMSAGTTVGIGDRLDARMHDQFQREYLGHWS